MVRAPPGRPRHGRDDIYLGTYEGPYCVACEAFKTENELVDGNCPIHGRPVEGSGRRTTSSACPRTRSGCSATTRSTPSSSSRRPPQRGRLVRPGGPPGPLDPPHGFDWGIPVPWDPSHVDLRVVRRPAELHHRGRVRDRRRRGSTATWPADVHVIGKDITRFHAVDLAGHADGRPGSSRPRRSSAHGFLTSAGEKMSKTNATGIHPFELLDHFGVDAYRYYFLREIRFGQDGSFTWESMTARTTPTSRTGWGTWPAGCWRWSSNFDGQVPERPAGAAPGPPGRGGGRARRAVRRGHPRPGR